MPGNLASWVLAAVLVAAAWADHHINHDEHTGHDGSLLCHKLAGPDAEFALALYKRLNAKTAAGKNIFYSPLGISAALSMLSAGAGGDTRSQLISTLGYGAFNQTEIDHAYEHFFSILRDNKENQQLDVGNMVALSSDFQASEQFVKDIKHHHSGETLNVDFRKPEAAAAEINQNVARKTNDKIKDLVKDLDPATVMVLLNYVYFRGQWEKTFDARNTAKDDFHVDESTTVKVDMMKRLGRYGVYNDNDNHTTVVRLPYKGNTSMVIVLPDEGKMKEVEDNFTMDRFKYWIQSLFTFSVEISMPKFSISADASLKEILMEMGITDAFSDTADFSGISEDVKVKVSKVSHKAVLSVDEAGTEAAAATTIEIIPMMLPEMVKLNRPFLVFILDHHTQSILFMGKINNPAAM